MLLKFNILCTSFVHYGVLVHEGTVVTVEGGIMHLKCIIQPRLLLHCPSALTNPIMHKKYLLLLTYQKQLLVLVKCALSN